MSKMSKCVNGKSGIFSVREKSNLMLSLLTSTWWHNKHILAVCGKFITFEPSYMAYSSQSPVAQRESVRPVCGTGS